MNPSNQLLIHHTAEDLAVENLADPLWEHASQILVARYWSGSPAPKGRRFSARLLWSAMALYVRFDASQNETLVVSDAPDLSRKTIGLWDRDVCEIFVAPDASQKDRYFEFEVAPTGEWVDLAINNASQNRVADVEYASGMTVAARIEPDRVIMVMKIPWTAFGMRPKTGDVWLGNIFRCVGTAETRGYLAWCPTMTARPNFHVPSAFGELRFVASELVPGTE